MAAAEQAPIAAPAFTVVRRGYDPEQVARHLNRIDAETTILAADRAAVVEQARQLSQQLTARRKELDTARAEIERLRGELRVLAGPPDTIDSMNERLQVMLRLAKDEFIGLQADASAKAAAHAAEIIAAIGADAGDAGGFGFDASALRRPRDEEELERMRRDAAAERTRLDEEAAARRAAADEEFRRVLALRCREVMAQLAKLQAEALRSARRVMDDAGEQARTVLADADEAVRRSVEDAQREVDDLQELRLHLAAQLDTSRRLLGRAIPAAWTARAAAAAARNGDSGSTTGSIPRSILAAEPASPATPAEQSPAVPSGRHAPGSALATTTSTGPFPPNAAGAASAGRHRCKHAVPPQFSASVSSTDTGPATPDARPTDGSSAGPHGGEHAVALQLFQPALPAPASLPAPSGRPLAPGSFADQPTDAAEPVRPAAVDPGSVL